MTFPVDPTWFALIGTIFGGVGLKIVEKFLNKNVERVSERKDYRDEIKELRERLDKVESEVDTWRERYYHNEEEIQTLRAFMIGMGIDPPVRVPLPPRPE